MPRPNDNPRSGHPFAPEPGEPCPAAYEQTFHPDEPGARRCYHCGAEITPYAPEPGGHDYIIPAHTVPASAVR